jgi:hypothetical protein
VSRTQLQSYGTAHGNTLSRCTLCLSAECSIECCLILLQAAIGRKSFCVVRY